MCQVNFLIHSEYIVSSATNDVMKSQLICKGIFVNECGYDYWFQLGSHAIYEILNTVFILRMSEKLN